MGMRGASCRRHVLWGMPRVWRYCSSSFWRFWRITTELIAKCIVSIWGHFWPHSWKSVGIGMLCVQGLKRKNATLSKRIKSLAEEELLTETATFFSPGGSLDVLYCEWAVTLKADSTCTVTSVCLPSYLIDFANSWCNSLPKPRLPLHHRALP